MKKITPFHNLKTKKQRIYGVLKDGMYGDEIDFEKQLDEIIPMDGEMEKLYQQIVMTSLQHQNETVRNLVTAKLVHHELKNTKLLIQKYFVDNFRRFLNNDPVDNQKLNNREVQEVMYFKAQKRYQEVRKHLNLQGMSRYGGDFAAIEPGVRSFIEKPIEHDATYLKKIKKLTMGPNVAMHWNLKDYYLFYKYILMGISLPKDLTHVDFMENVGKTAAKIPPVKDVKMKMESEESEESDDEFFSAEIEESEPEPDDKAPDLPTNVSDEIKDEVKIQADEPSTHVDPIPMEEEEKPKKEEEKEEEKKEENDRALFEEIKRQMDEYNAKMSQAEKERLERNEKDENDRKQMEEHRKQLEETMQNLSAKETLLNQEKARLEQQEKDLKTAEAEATQTLLDQQNRSIAEINNLRNAIIDEKHKLEEEKRRFAESVHQQKQESPKTEPKPEPVPNPEPPKEEPKQEPKKEPVQKEEKKPEPEPKEEKKTKPPEVHFKKEEKPSKRAVKRPHQEETPEMFPLKKKNKLEKKPKPEGFPFQEPKKHTYKEPEDLTRKRPKRGREEETKEGEPEAKRKTSYQTQRNRDLYSKAREAIDNLENVLKHTDPAKSYEIVKQMYKGMSDDLKEKFKESLENRNPKLKELLEESIRDSDATLNGGNIYVWMRERSKKGISRTKLEDHLVKRLPKMTEPNIEKLHQLIKRSNKEPFFEDLVHSFNAALKKVNIRTYHIQPTGKSKKK